MTSRQNISDRLDSLEHHAGLTGRLIMPVWVRRGESLRAALERSVPPGVEVFLAIIAPETSATAEDWVRECKEDGCFDSDDEKRERRERYEQAIDPPWVGGHHDTGRIVNEILARKRSEPPRQR